MRVIQPVLLLGLFFLLQWRIWPIKSTVSLCLHSFSLSIPCLKERRTKLVVERVFKHGGQNTWGPSLWTTRLWSSFCCRRPTSSWSRCCSTSAFLPLYPFDQNLLLTSGLALCQPLICLLTEHTSSCNVGVLRAWAVIPGGAACSDGARPSHSPQI